MKTPITTEEIQVKITSLNQEDRNIFNLLAINAFEEIPNAIGDKFVELGLVGKDDYAYSMPTSVHIAWCDLCSKEVED